MSTTLSRTKLEGIADLFKQSRMSEFEKNAWLKIIPYMEEDEFSEFTEILKKEIVK